MLPTHAIVGVIGSIVFNWGFLLGSILPDISLLYNEIKIQTRRKKFDPSEVSKIELSIYRFTHSLIFVFLLIPFPSIALGCLFHQVMDWYSHDGIFKTMIFYPFSRRTIMSRVVRAVSKVVMSNEYGHWLPLVTRCPMRKFWLDFGFVRVKTDKVIEVFGMRRIIYSFTWKRKFIEEILIDIKNKIEKESLVKGITLEYTQLFGKLKTIIR